MIASSAQSLLVVVACALIDADGRVLIAQRPAGKAMEGLWEFPGGKIEADETPETALIRELSEELGIAVKESCLAPFTFASHGYGEFHLLMPLYVCRRWEGTPAPIQHAALKWVRPRDLAQYDMPPADLPLIPMLRDLLLIFAQDERAATSIEYALIASLISIMIVAGVTSIGTKLSTFFTAASANLK